MADIITGLSSYATGTNDTASTLVNNVSATDAIQPNGIASAAVQIEQILGIGTTLKGSAADLGARLAVEHNSDGTQKLLTVPKGGTGLTTITAGGICAGNGTSAIAPSLAGTAGVFPQVLVSGGSSIPVWKDQTGLFDCQSYAEFYDDFYYSTGAWTVTIGTFSILGGSTGRGRFEDGGININIFVDASFTPTNLILSMKIAQLVTEAGTRRIGLADASLESDPTNGIYARFALNGNLILVSRAAGTESTLDSGIAQSNGVYHTCRFVVTGTTSVVAYVDGTLVGTITTNIPSTSLTPRVGLSGSQPTAGVDCDYFHVIAAR